MIQSMGFSRPEYWSGQSFLLQVIFPTQGSNPGLQHCRQILLTIFIWVYFQAFYSVHLCVVYFTSDTVLITLDLWYILKSGLLVSTLILLLQHCVGYSEIFTSSKHFKISLLIATKKLTGILIGTVLNLQLKMGRLHLNNSESIHEMEYLFSSLKIFMHFIYGFVGSLLLYISFLQLREQGPLSSYGAWPSHCSGKSQFFFFFNFIYQCFVVFVSWILYIFC